MVDKARDRRASQELQDRWHAAEPFMRLRSYLEDVFDRVESPTDKRQKRNLKAIEVIQNLKDIPAGWCESHFRDHFNCEDITRHLDAGRLPKIVSDEDGTEYFDLRGFSLVHCCLPRGFTFRHCDFSHFLGNCFVSAMCRFHECLFDHADLGEGTEMAYYFVRCRFRHTVWQRLYGAFGAFYYFGNCLFDHCNLRKRRFRCNLIENCTFTDCDMRGGGVLQARLVNVTFTRCNMRNFNFEAEQFENCSFIDCRIANPENGVLPPGVTL